MFNTGQNVKFVTRNGNAEGITGQGIVTEVQEDIINKYIVTETYTVESGPYEGQEITRRVMCLASEMETI